MILNTQYIGKEPVVKGKLASEYKVGDSVFLHVNNAPVEFLVVNQGIPSGSNLYDESCNGTWLLMKDIYTGTRAWDTSGKDKYAESSVDEWLNGDFIASFGTAEQSVIKEAKIPYRTTGASTGTRLSGANGLPCKAFLLSCYEMGWTQSDNSTMPAAGARLDYFDSGTGAAANSKRIAYQNGTIRAYWTRDCVLNISKNAFLVLGTGAYSGSYPTSDSGRVRPALIIPFSTRFDPDTNEFISASTGGV